MSEDNNTNELKSKLNYITIINAEAIATISMLNACLCYSCSFKEMQICHIEEASCQNIITGHNLFSRMLRRDKQTDHNTISS